METEREKGISLTVSENIFILLKIYVKIMKYMHTWKVLRNMPMH